MDFILNTDFVFKYSTTIFNMVYYSMILHIYSLVQDCSISIANTLEILQSCTKSLYSLTVTNVEYLIEAEWRIYASVN